jgi:hypothetical protein
MGKLKGKIIKSPDTGKLVVRDTDTRVTYEFDQPFQAVLGIVEKTSVNYDLVDVDGRNIAVAVQPIYKGEIVTIDYEKGVGEILERESNTTYNFQQNYLKQSGYAQGETVKYTLVNSDGALWATCLNKIV